MSFPKIKRSPLHTFDDWIHGHTPESVKAERKSRAAWARFLAERVKNLEYGSKFIRDRNEVIDELLRQAEADERG